MLRVKIHREYTVNRLVLYLGGGTYKSLASHMGKCLRSLLNPPLFPPGLNGNSKAKFPRL